MSRLNFVGAISLLASLVLLQLSALGQVDTLKSKSAVEKYIQQKFNYRSVKLLPTDQLSSYSSKFDSAKASYWLVSDINHDGINDLIVSAKVESGKNKEYDRLLAITSNKARFTKIELDNQYYYDFMSRSIISVKLNAIRSKQYLLVSVSNYKKNKGEEGYMETTTDTVFVKDNKSILYSSKPSSATFKSISFITSGCYGSCPVFELVLNADRTVTYNGIEYVSRKGEHNLIASQTDIRYLNELIKNLCLHRLKDEYAVRWTDDQTSKLVVTFQDGTSKTITDYGMKGTYGLAMLYDFLMELRNF